MRERPLIVGLGGTVAATSSTEKCLRVALGAAEAAGAQTRLIGGAMLARLPMFGTVLASEAGDEMLAAIRAAQGIIIASPAYHGSVSGLVKNALDYVEGTSRDARVYFDGMPVGLIATAAGSQATGSTLGALRSIVHALRGWPTPMGGTVTTSGGLFDGDRCTDERVTAQLRLIGEQVVQFAAMRAAHLAASPGCAASATHATSAGRRIGVLVAARP